MTTLFRSKVDGKLKAIGLSMPCIALIAIATSPSFATRLLWLPVIAVISGAILVTWVVLSTYYEFAVDALMVHSGPFSWRIRFKDISAVRESSSVRSGPALSMDRLEIAFDHGKALLISPADKAGFLAALYRRAPQLVSREPAR
jgi:Bacterial PH domain